MRLWESKCLLWNYVFIKVTDCLKARPLKASFQEYMGLFLLHHETELKTLAAVLPARYFRWSRISVTLDELEVCSEPRQRWQRRREVEGVYTDAWVAVVLEESRGHPGPAATRLTCPVWSSFGRLVSSAGAGATVAFQRILQGNVRSWGEGNPERMRVMQRDNKGRCYQGTEENSFSTSPTGIKIINKVGREK